MLAFWGRLGEVWGLWGEALKARMGRKGRLAWSLCVCPSVHKFT